MNDETIGLVIATGFTLWLLIALAEFGYYLYKRFTR